MWNVIERKPQCPVLIALISSLIFSIYLTIKFPYSVDPDDLMAEGVSKADGTFTLAGSEKEVLSINRQF